MVNAEDISEQMEATALQQRWARTRLTTDA